MPQFIPFTLLLQWNSIIFIISLTIIILAIYILPKRSKLLIARTTLSV